LPSAARWWAELEVQLSCSCTQDTLWGIRTKGKLLLCSLSASKASLCLTTYTKRVFFEAITFSN
jgi:hypothetical protein